MPNNKQLKWIWLGSILTFLLGICLSTVYHATTWAPVLIEIASVTWNDAPLL